MTYVVVPAEDLLHEEVVKINALSISLALTHLEVLCSDPTAAREGGCASATREESAEGASAAGAGAAAGAWALALAAYSASTQ